MVGGKVDKEMMQCKMPPARNMGKLSYSLNASTLSAYGRAQ